MLHSSFVTLYNYYGPTEASPYATGKHVLRDQLPGRLASIGKPLPNVTCYVSHTHGTRDTRTRESCSAIGEASLVATAQAQHQVQRRLLLDVVVRERAAVLELLAGKDEALRARTASGERHVAGLRRGRATARAPPPARGRPNTLA